MKISTTERRSALKAMLSGVLWVSTAIVAAEDAPLLSEEDPADKALQYVSDASKAKDANAGNKCANCSLYAGDAKSTQASCAVFNNKQVLASGWCSAWTNM